MPKSAVVRYATLRSALVNLPLSLYAPLLEKGIAPQSLAIELSWRGSSNRVVLGWSGMPSKMATPDSVRQPSLSTETLEIDSQYARELNLKEGQQVTIELKLSIPTAKRVDITPLSVDDWEVLERNADHVEQNMLSQVRAVSLQQPLCVWAGKSQTVLRFKVDAIEPPHSKAARLTNDTEVVIAPKSRKPAAKPQMQTLVSAGDEENAEDDTITRLYRLLPLEMLDLLHDPFNDSEQPIIAVHPTTQVILKRLYPSGKCSVSLERRSSDDLMSTNTSSLRKKRKRTCDSAAYKVDDRIPDGHFWANELVRKMLNLSTSLEQGYEMASLGKPNKAKDAMQSHLSPAETSDAASSSPKQRRLKDLPLSPASASHLHPESDSQPLCGVQSLMEGSLEFLRAGQTAWYQGTALPGILVTGMQGSGKTLFLETLARKAKLDLDCLTSIQYYDCSKFTEERPQSMKEMFRDWFEEASWKAPACVVLDNLDRMLSAEMEHVDSFRVLHLAHLFVSAFAAAAKSKPIVLVASVQNASTYHALLREAHLFGKVIGLKPPNKEARKEILQSLVEKKTKTLPRVKLEVDFAQVAADTEGYLPADLRNLADRAMIQFIAKGHEAGDLSTDTFQQAQVDFVPMSLRDVKLQTSTVRWSDIGGLRETRQVLRETLEWPTRYAAIFAQSPLRLRSGLLLYGYPGCGKTLLASAVAKECGLNFISIKGPELLNKYIGASEQSVRDLFERAQAAKPCVLFFDEFDSIAPRRGHDSTGVTDRVVNQMLTQMDGAEGLDGVYVLAATSRPDLIDPALLRPGRLDKSLLCDMPNVTDRLEIMQACAQKITLASTIDLQSLADETSGYSGADLQALIYNAHLEAVHDQMESSVGKSTKIGDQVTQLVYRTDSNTNTNGVFTAAEQKAYEDKLRRMLRSNAVTSHSDKSATTSTKANADRPKIVVQEKHIFKSLEMTRPSVPDSELRRLRRIYNDFVAKRSTDGLPSGEASNEIGGRVSLM